MIKEKLELAGNLTACVLRKDAIGIERYYFGEFFFLDNLVSGEATVCKNSRWELSGITRNFEEGVTERLTIYEDVLHYSLSGYHAKIELNPPSDARKLERALLLQSEGWWLCILFEKSRGLFELCIVGDSHKKSALENAKRYLHSHETLSTLRETKFRALLRKTKTRDRFKLYCWYVLLSNGVKTKHPVLKKRFTMPSKYSFRHQWLWDSCFHSIVLSLYDVKLAKEELENLFLAQKQDGRIPHEIFLSKSACKRFWGVDDFSPWTTQPPVLAVSVERILETSWDEGFAKKAFKVLLKYDEWWNKKRDEDFDLLCSYHDPLESGWDDSVRWDDVKVQESPHGMYPVEAVDLNCLLYKQRSVLSHLAKRLGFGELAKNYENLAQQSAQLVRKKMWDGDFFYDLVSGSHKMLKVKTPAAFLTLFSRVADNSQAKTLVKHLFNKEEFWTAFPLPTVSKDHPKYDPEGYWRGRSWVNLVWFAYHGLKNYGFYEEASKLAKKVFRAMKKSFSCRENYNSATAEPMGAVDFGWSTLILDIAKQEAL